jgi:hypothetical protein
MPEATPPCGRGRRRHRHPRAVATESAGSHPILSEATEGPGLRATTADHLAAFAQFDNDVRSDRTRAGIRTALELGRWTFPAPLGYLDAPKWRARASCMTPNAGRS